MQKRAGLPATKELILKGVKLDLVLVPAGKFVLGSPENDPEKCYDEMQYEVTLTTPYYMGKCEVTQAQWEAVMGNNPSEYKGKENPVEQVSWNEIQGFLKQGRKFPMPSGYTTCTAMWMSGVRIGMTGMGTLEE